eukprot:CAMPEP_0171460906 /NCGR_PEP_ID=MMETSP0945-20130129/5585_1 /TAXON_ID=109269 /ORGANISM="Vaucheria litorea, Strain CCMP2940" /LENGTH=506 /DNA_ID=CAMNT_0011987183 /DNA_START=133 /DNA_END=1653 /DNA_ORIENTATION=+
MTSTKRKRGKSNKEMDKVLEKYEPVIGIEIHVQLLTNSKAYCSCKSLYAPNEPNSNVCPVCMGEPGALPVPNRKVIELAAKTALALNCKISDSLKWDRKNYFYPDTPKNYQITQYDNPIGSNGTVQLPFGGKVGIQRLHMEEDSAKMNHQNSESSSGSLSGSLYSLIDFNRAGIPLAEIVSEPDITSGLSAAEYGKELQRILRYIGASDGNMAEGSMRLDVNVSIREKGSNELRNKVELKNLNSFRAVQESTDHEIIRQAKLYEEGQRVRQETRLWDDKAKVSKIMRVKEGESDYRYFPEPDIPAMKLPKEVVKKWKSELSELPSEKRSRYKAEFGLSDADIEILTDDKDLSSYFESTVEFGSDPKEVSKWLLGDVSGYINSNRIQVKDLRLTPERLSELIVLIKSKKISGKIAKELLPELLNGSFDGTVAELVREKGMELITDEKVIETFAREVIGKNSNKVSEYRSGKTKLLGFFAGQTLAVSNNRADPEAVQKIVKLLLDNEN